MRKRKQVRTKDKELEAVAMEVNQLVSFSEVQHEFVFAYINKDNIVSLNLKVNTTTTTVSTVP